MERNIEIQGNKYQYATNYKYNEVFRRSFNELAEKTFGINFERWYQEGYWNDKYIPYSLLDKEKIVANVSVNIVDVLIDGNKGRYMQIGTVMVDECYRGLGLSKVLMDKVLDEWENKCDLIYLFANDRVLDFYPKFGFEKCDEYQHSINKTKYKDIRKARKLNIEEDFDKEILKKLISEKLSISKLNVENNISLIMFYCLDFMKDNIYYIEDCDAVAICEYNKDILVVIDVFIMKEIDLDEIINILMTDETKKVVMGFTPNNVFGYDEALLKEDTTLFIRTIKENPFKIKKLMFPILSHA